MLRRLTEITSVTIPYNCLHGLAGVRSANCGAIRRVAHAPLRAARRRLIYGPKEGDSR
jgi:hypothetical protein